MTTLRRCWSTDAPLTATGLLMVAALAASLAGLGLDARVITGVPAWLKPAKFAISIAIYAWTLVWVFTYLPEWTRIRRIAGWTTAITLVFEVAIIDAQAWRGTTSHFNVGTPLDAALFTSMGAAIVLQTFAAVLVAIALWRQQFADRALGWAFRLGMTITIIGASTGGLMTAPTSAQIAAARATHRMPLSGAHTVGAPDGGPGLRGIGWSREHGDLRIPHFLGLHALQGLALFAVVLPRRHRDVRRVRLTFVAAASYVTLFLVLLVQALRGESLIAPSAPIVVMFGVWAIGTALAAWLALAARGETPPAFGAPNAAAALGTPFGRRCIPAPPHRAEKRAVGAPAADGVAPPSNIPDIAPTVRKTHGEGPALRSSRRSAGVPTARTVRRGVVQRGASPPSVPRRTFTTDC